MPTTKTYKADRNDKFSLYVKERLLPELGLENSKFIIEPTDKGCHSLITFLDINDFKPLVIRGVRKKYKLQRILKNTYFLRQSGFNAPEVLYVDDSRKTYNEFGNYLVVEERIEGSSLSEFEDPAAFLPLIARIFADLHSINADKWGMIGAQKKSGFFRYINQKTQYELSQISKKNQNVFTAREIKAYSKWFKNHKNIIKNRHCYNLCHGDPYLTNISITNDNNLYLLDNDHTKFYPMAIEFYKLGFVLNQDDQENMANWENLYCSSLPEHLRAEFQRTQNFYLAYVLLHIILGLLEDNWRRERPYAFSPDYAGNLFRQCIEG